MMMGNSGDLTDNSGDLTDHNEYIQDWDIMNIQYHRKIDIISSPEIKLSRTQ